MIELVKNRMSELKVEMEINEKIKKDVDSMQWEEKMSPKMQRRRRNAVVDLNNLEAQYITNEKVLVCNGIRNVSN